MTTAHCPVPEAVPVIEVDVTDLAPPPPKYNAPDMAVGVLARLRQPWTAQDLYWGKHVFWKPEITREMVAAATLLVRAAGYEVYHIASSTCPVGWVQAPNTKKNRRDLSCPPEVVSAA